MLYRTAGLAAVTLVGLAGVAGIAVLAIAPEARRAAAHQVRAVALAARRRAMGLYEDFEDALARQRAPADPDGGARSYPPAPGPAGETD